MMEVLSMDTFGHRGNPFELGDPILTFGEGSSGLGFPGEFIVNNYA